MNDERDEIRQRIDLVDLVSQRVRLKRSGKNYLGLCPFHEDKTPSFNVSQATGRYKCFACGESGDVFTWVMKSQGLDFVEALKLLAAQAGVTLSARSDVPRVDKSERERQLGAMNAAQQFFKDQFFKSSVAKNYLDNRGIDQATIQDWELGYAPDVGEALATHLKKHGFQLGECADLFLVQQDSGGSYFDKFRGRLMFPIRDEKGDLVGYGGRVLGDGTPKYINSSDTPLYRKSKVLYGFHRARDRMMKERHAVLVEGYLDVIACHRAGVTEAVASLGTSLAEEHVRLLKRFSDKVTILYDADKAGQKAAQRAVELFTEAGLPCRVALMPQGEDPDTLLRSKGAEAVRQAVKQSQSPFDFKVFLLEQQFGIESEEFWSQIPTVLAEAESELDLERHLLRLAGRHPTIGSPMEAARALRREVMNLKKGFKSGRRYSAPVTSASTSSKSLSAAEAVIFRAALDTQFRSLVWQFVLKPDFFINRFAMDLSRAFARVFDSTVPKISTKELIAILDNEEDQQAVADLEFDSRVQSLTNDYILDSLKKVETQKTGMKLSNDREKIASDDDSAQMDYLLRLRKLKGIDGERKDT